jgi:uncharacterized membrane protein
MADAEEPGGHQSSADERPSSGLIMERLGEAEAEDDTELVHREMEFAAAERLMFFTDAVVAIALTLLALQLPIPGGIENVPRSSSEMVRDAGQHFDDYLAFLISFVVIAAHWRLHHRVFRYVRVASRAMQFAIFAVIIVLILRTQHVPAGSDAQHMEDGLWQTIALAVGFAVSIPLYLLIGQWAFAVWAVASLIGNLIRSQWHRHRRSRAAGPSSS